MAAACDPRALPVAHSVPLLRRPALRLVEELIADAHEVRGEVSDAGGVGSLDLVDDSARGGLVQLHHGVHGALVQCRAVEFPPVNRVGDSLVHLGGELLKHGVV
eukprot:CAMPEP_0198701098 /NCGR_PEP_ID=MMETSP1468-20131203/379562_1 /TAXON_ID=1461545 /ORGANISM="Mantoniella sp, Strain CCMP1436" /LENGTH=103 /DNA_ID=CAMNT_0044459271 /DNA_START=382 /DNA_END=690 /DNA_ORIENTATION=+